LHQPEGWSRREVAEEAPKGPKPLGTSLGPGQARDMHGFWRTTASLGLAALMVTSCGGGRSASTARSSTTSTSGPGSTTTPIASTAPPSTSPATTTTTPLAVHVTVSPDQVVAGTVVTFTVEIRGPGTLNSEGVQFGDGGTSGANAGMIRCGDSARADHTSTYTHSFDAPGNYTFSDAVSVIGPSPACAPENVTATATVSVA